MKGLDRGFVKGGVLGGAFVKWGFLEIAVLGVASGISGFRSERV